jgi:hypothetical protein
MFRKSGNRFSGNNMRKAKTHMFQKGGSRLSDKSMRKNGRI